MFWHSLNLLAHRPFHIGIDFSTSVINYQTKLLRVIKSSYSSLKGQSLEMIVKLRWSKSGQFRYVIGSNYLASSTKQMMLRFYISFSIKQHSQFVSTKVLKFSLDALSFKPILKVDD